MANLPSAARDSEYLAGMAGLSYPFTAEYADPTVNRLFAELTLCVAGEEASGTPRLSAIELAGTYGSETFDLIVNDGVRNYDTTGGGVTHVAEHTGEWVTHSWRKQNVVHPFFLCVTLKRSEYEAALTAGGLSYTGMDLPIHARGLWTQPSKLRYLKVDGVGINSLKPIQFKAGQAAVVAADGNRVTIDVDPNTTVGAEADCSDNVDVIRTINGIAGDDYGGFFITAESCHKVTNLTSYSSPVEAQLALANGCVPCTDCDLLVDTYERLRSVFQVAASNRVRLCDMITVFNDYVALVTAVDTRLREFQIESVFEQTDYESFACVFRLHVGPLSIKKVELTVSYDTAIAGVEVAFQPYSGREKVFGFAARQKLLVTSTPSTPNTGAEFDGTYLEYDATGNVSSTALRATTHAAWYWNMYLRDPVGPPGTEVPVDITWQMVVTFVDNTTYDTGAVTETVTIISQGGGSA